MIDAAIGHLVGQLNQHFRRSFQVAEDLAVMSNLLEQNGTQVPLTVNKLVLFLSGIERDSAAQRSGERTDFGQASRIQGHAPIHLNLMVMCAANFSGSNYPEALKFLSAAIAFFQGKPVLDHHNTPELDPRLERLVLSIENLSRSELQSLWSINGNRYLPSVLYRVRLVSLDSGAIAARDSLIRDADVEALA